MSLHQIPYTPELYLPIREFLIVTYDPAAAHHNWQIDRWNFCRYVSQVIHETEDTWPGTVGVWVDEAGSIQAAVHSEGEKGGDVHFQLAPRHFTDTELGQFLDHAEGHLGVEEEGRRVLRPWVCPTFTQLTALLQARGYRRTGGSSVSGRMLIGDRLAVSIPEGLRLVDGAAFDDSARARAHSLAFGYGREDPSAVERYHMVEAFSNMRRAPDYREALDLAVLTPDGEVAAFACFWLDEANRYGVLEPLGTVPAYQRQGLARSLIWEGLNRLGERGADILYGPVNQEFYLQVGFQPVYEFRIWEKTLR